MRDVTEARLEEALDNARQCTNDYSGMSFQEGVVSAMEWFLEMISDEDFEY